MKPNRRDTAVRSLLWMPCPFSIGVQPMPRHYTDAEKRLVLDRLIANHGDIPRTATETGV